MAGCSSVWSCVDRMWCDEVIFRRFVKRWLDVVLERVQAKGRGHKFEDNVEFLVALGGRCTDVVRFGERA